MGRHPGVRSVGRIEDPKSKSAVDLKLETDTMTFYAIVGTQTFKSKDGDKVRRDALAALKALRSVDWKPVIIVESEDGDPDTSRNVNGRERKSLTAQVQIEARRTYLGVVGKQIQELQWDTYRTVTDPEQRVERSAFAGLNQSIKDLDSLPFSSQFMPHFASATEYILPYDEDTWKGIAAIMESVQRSRENLNAILHSKDAPAFLALVGSGKVALPMPALPKQIAAKSSE